MPVYEYVCEKCGEQFEALRPMADSDAMIRCPACKSKRTSRTISVFAAHSGG